ncbi:Zinc finger CCHC domain-containing protein 3 [Holothuria leucospilota]|uniref:Zinc finger CCHC domain-containing protein 3 n=1 Tax=Holothuria leucospilota TaxID=206669 RepID=A0A9Q1C3Q7_HOLLE|nr:Zinc finger CCHC domain-containing protein 3 [Holothuria leucospilota]
MRKFFPPLSRANGYTVSPYTNSATTVVTVLYVPHELDDNVVRFVLGKYGNVVCGRFVTFADYPHVYNGKRQYQIQLHSDIPSSIRLGGRNCWVRYYGQPRTCLKCGGKGHNVKDCQETVCFKCQSLGHIAKECVAEIKCSVCEKVGHSHKECPVSFANKINPAPLRWIASDAEIDGCEDESDEAETVAVTNPPTLQNTQGAEANTAENTSVIETHMEVDMESQSQSQSLFKGVQGTLLPNPPTCEHELVSKQTAEQKESQIAMDTSKEQLPISLSAEEPKVHSPLHRDTEEVDKHVAHPVVSDACASVPPSTNNPEEVDTNIESQALTESTKEQLPTSPSTEKPVDQSPLPPSEQGSTPHSVRIARQKKKRLLLLQRVCCNSNEDEVDNIIESELRGACIRSRVKILEENEKPSAFFYREERRRAERKVIKSIKNDDGRIVSSNSEITGVFHNFYTNLFTRHADVNLNLQDAFIQCLNHKISDDDKRILDEPISLVELNKAVSRAASNKSPGSDGLRRMNSIRALLTS